MHVGGEFNRKNIRTTECVVVWAMRAALNRMKMEAEV
jgi:hypothetical protein